MADTDIDLDPAAPGGTETPDQSAIDAANFGLDGKGDLPPGASEDLALQNIGTVAFNVANALAFLQQCENSKPRVGYKLGAKIPAGGVPGKDLTAVDCSGFVREEMRRSTSLGNAFPDGSVVQHDWVKSRGFASVANTAGSLKDGTVRIAFLSPTPTRKIGHVALVYNGATIKSHGGVGPDSRQWNGQGWQAQTSMYVLANATT
jgi:hypothetical protein